MSEKAPRERLSSSPAVCPGLSQTLRWDEAQFLRGELYVAEHLSAHSEVLARAHGKPVCERGRSPLGPRFRQARERVEQAYAILARDASTRRDPSPAEEWLLDNGSVVQDQIREISEDLPPGYLVKLPRLAQGAMRGYPRVYGLCIDYLRHTDARVDLDSITQFVLAYQRVERLTIGELWAVPIMLRLGLVASLGALAISETSVEESARVDACVARLVAARAPEQIRAELGQLSRVREAPSARFLVLLLRRLREHDVVLDLAREWVAERCAELETTIDDLTRREYRRQAGDQVCVANAITSMRVISAADWDVFFERTSDVEAALARDPLGAYAESDKETRDRFRHAVETLASRSHTDELAVAELALSLAERSRDAGAGDARAHVGYYLIDAGRRELERKLGYRSPLRARVVRAIEGQPAAFYFGALILVLLLLLGAAAFEFRELVASWPILVAVLAVYALLASEIALGFVDSLVVALLPPKLLAKFEFKAGIPAAHPTLVAVPALLDSVATLEQLVSDLEVRALANADDALHFALVTDFVDAPAESMPGDDELLELARESIRALNERHERPARFWLLHRRRLENPAEGCFMGWERKRGKLEELNRLLRGDSSTSFTVVTAPTEMLRAIRYVITLDADTDLPRDSARKLVATLAHPLTRPELDPLTRRVVRGHAILQPRVGTLPASSRRSRYAAIMAGTSGLDPYTSAVSDTYQDLFGCGSFVGKGIYDVDAFTASLHGRVPENHLLSHDLFEGIFARSALCTDIEVLDEQPLSYVVHSGRQHRWMRGDWQLLPWLLPNVPARGGRRRSDLGAFDYFRVFDNLRRSLLAPAVVAACTLSWFLAPALAGAMLAVIGFVFVVPQSARWVLALVRPPPASRRFVGSFGEELGATSARLAVNLVFTLDQAWVCCDAVARTAYRLCFSRRKLLEWTAMRQSAGSGGAHVARRLWLGSAGCVGVALGLWLMRTPSLPFALPLLGSWAVAPLLSAWLARPLRRGFGDEQLPAADRDLLAATAQKTWRFFDTFVTAADNFLPPDNFQEAPQGVIAHRTSPTNIGLYMLSVLAARDFSFIGLGETVRRLLETLGSLEGLEKYEGHILNWYDTTNLAPLEPRYVSTVDSGNLAAYLWTIEQGCVDLTEAPLVSRSVLDAARSALQLARAELVGPACEPQRELLLELERRIESRAQSWGDAGDPGAELRAAERALSELRTALLADLPEPAAYWLERAELTTSEAVTELAELCPFWGVNALASPIFERPQLSGDVTELRRCLRAGGSLLELTRLPESVSELVRRLSLTLAAQELSSEERALAEHELDSVMSLVERGARGAEELMLSIEQVQRRARLLASAMNFRFLYDAERELFAIGYNVSSARLDGSRYDLLASEARLASLLCIAKGDVPQTHWFHLGRQRARLVGGPGLLSWSGSMFEYLMPLLVTEDNPATLLHESYTAAVERQRRYARDRGVPWGISESAYNVMDLRMTYQYRAFGVPGLGLKSGLGDFLVVAPYATVLAGLVHPGAVAPNLRRLAAEGLSGDYGYYEAIDYTPDHVPPGRRGIVVRAFMAHHQGMTLVALGEILNGSPMRRRFHADPRIKATQLLLEERIPARADALDVHAVLMPAAVRGEHAPDVIEHVGLAARGPIRMHLLGHGELACVIGATGIGVTLWKGMDVNRFREDPLLEAGGIYLYVRNLTDGKLWSAAYQPTRAEPEFYNVAFSLDRVEFNRRDGDVQTLTEVALSPEHAAEIRRITLTNHGARPLDLELTSYTEVVLAPRGADVAHRTFSSLFVEAEVLAERGAMLARRRPRGAGETEIWAGQALVFEGEDTGAFDYDGSRPGFLGRGRSAADPVGLTAEQLGRQTGHVLDPAFVLRRRVRLAPGAHVRLTLLTGLGASRDEVVTLLEAYSAPATVAHALELGWAAVRVELRHLDTSSADVQRYQRLLSAVLLPEPSLRVAGEPPPGVANGISALWAHGISGDLPIVLCRIDNHDFEELCRDLLLAREFFRLNGFDSDLVIINEEPSGYLQPVQDSIRELARQAPLDRKGGVFLRRVDQMSAEERELITCAARVVLRSSQGSLSRQLRRASQGRPMPDVFTPQRSLALAAAVAPPPARPELEFDNEFGGFARGGQDYVMLVEPGRPTPAPWCNVMANPEFGTLTSELGSSFTWWRNAQRHRLTPWSNDATSDPSGEAFYVRDDEDGAFWSATPAPAGAGATYVVTHSQGYTRFEHTRRALEHELVMFVAASDPVKFVRLRLCNRGAHARKLSVFGVVEWVLGANREISRSYVSTSWSSEHQALLARNPLSLFPASRAFFAADSKGVGHSGDREEFYGVSGSRSNPDALSRAVLSGRVGAGFDPAAALQLEVSLKPGQAGEVCFLLGHAGSLADAEALIARYREPGAIQRAFQSMEGGWQSVLGGVQVRTPDHAFDFLVNHWLLYQTLSSRIWARTGFYQSSGAYGFRDQLQDVLALLHSRPDLAREHLLRAAARQFEEGDVQHWWHAETGDGLRTQCSDDLAWLPYATAEYVRHTADVGVLDEAIPFLRERVLEPEEHDLFSSPAVSEERASLYEHCVRALTAAVTVGPHGLPAMRGGDWNDGMNRVGEQGRGESVWLAWFLAKTLGDFAALASEAGDGARAGWCRQQASRLARAIDEHAWDGEWYRRAYFDDGTPLGSKDNQECRIDAIAQSWAVIAGVGNPDRALQALRASESRLVNEPLALMQLLDPPFQRSEPDPGYVRAYPPGIRENGGQYTHGVLWTVQALALAREGERAHALFALLNPVYHATTRKDAERYRVEPFVVAADVYASNEHGGRGGWTWYTGSAGWMYRIALSNLLGVHREGDTLSFDPNVPRHWRGFEVRYHHGATRYDISVDNPARVSHGVARVALDGRPLPDNCIRLVQDGKIHRVEVTLGHAELEQRAVARRY